MNHAGYMLWDRHKYYLSWSLQEQLVGLEELNDGNWVVHFGSRALAVVDATTKTLRPIPDENGLRGSRRGRRKKRSTNETAAAVPDGTVESDQ